MGWNAARASLSLLTDFINRNRAVSDKYGVEMYAYEGGNELHGRDTTAYQTSLQSLAERAQRDTRMGDIYTSLFNTWKSVNGNLFMVFESTGSYSYSRGNSTLLEWTGQARADAPKYDAVLRFIENNACWWPDCGACQEFCV